MPNYKSFDDVLSDLNMDEDELKRLVSEGQIRAFRDEDRMKFRSEDVHALSSARVGGGLGGDDIDLGETQLGGDGLEIIEEETDETMLDLGDLTGDADFEDTGATSVPTVELSDIGEDDDATLTEELVFDETDELGGLDFGEDDADATQKIDGGLDFGDDDLGLETEPVDDGMNLDDLDELDDVGGGVDELDELGTEIGGMETSDEYYDAPPPAMGMPAPVQIQEQVKYVEIVPNEGIAWKVLTGVTFFLFLLLFTTLPAIGLMGSEDVLTPFFGQTGHDLYLKSSNENLHDKQPYKRPPEAAKTATVGIPVSVSKDAKHVLWPGMEIQRKFSGQAVSAASGDNEGEAAEEPTEEPEE